jgi:hypothetical protein
MAQTLMTEIDDSSRGGARSVMLVAITTAALGVFLLIFGFDVFHLAGKPNSSEPTTTQQSTQP